MTKTKISLIALFGICLGVIVTIVNVEPKIEYVREYVPAPTLDEIIKERASSIINSQTFKDEITALATARALYQLSVEKGDVAVDLSAMALESYRKSELLSSNWKVYDNSN